MAVSELWVCDACGDDAVLVHAQEWTPGPHAEVLPYEGTGPVGGLVNRVWCPDCRRVQPHVFVRLNPPGAHAVIAYAEAQRIGCTGTETGPCPRCGTQLIWNLEALPCAKCPQGTYHFTGEWEDAV
ncbi:MAG: hypothetical protein H7Z41_13390 [Cytophagales bacterium]|nr:hypothetical protein [Armatimonadota bacterium]